MHGQNHIKNVSSYPFLSGRQETCRFCIATSQFFRDKV